MNNNNTENLQTETKEGLLNGKSSESQEKEKGKVSLRQLFHYATSQDIILMICGSVAALANGVSMPLFAIVFGNMAESFNPANMGQTVVELASKYSLYFVYIAIGSFFCSFVMFSCWMATGTRQGIEYRKAYFNALLQQDIEWYDKINPNELATKVAKDCFAVQNGIGEKVSTCFMFFAMFIAGFVVGLTQGWKLALVLIASMPVVAFAGLLFVTVIQNFEKWNRKIYNTNAASSEESIIAIRTVKALSGEEFSHNIYIEALKKCKKITLKYSSLCGVALGFMFFAMFADYALGFWYGSVLIEDKEWNDIKKNAYNMGDVLTVFFAIIMGMMVMGQAGPAVKSITDGRIWQVMNRKPKIIIDDPTKININTLGGNISMQNIDFNYPTRPDKTVLKNLNIEFLVQKKNALVGKSGCGKTTIMQLIERFYDPLSGVVQIDGRDIKEYNLESLRKHIGYVGQEPVLFAASIRENLKYGNENATDEELIVALQQANVWDDINKRTEKKLDTYVGVGGAQFSGGQKQRIAIARAILKNPQVLLLDEATSALDRSNEQAIQKTLDEISEGRTTIAIAHRLSTIKNADRIFVIDQGQVAEFGTHEELMLMENGIYRSLAISQQMEEKAEEMIGFEEDKNDIVLEEKVKENNEVAVRKMSSNSKAIRALSNDFEKEQMMEKPMTAEEKKKAEAEKKKAESERMKKVMSRLFSFNKGSLGFFLLGVFGSAAYGVIFPLYAIILAEMLEILAMPYAKDYRERVNFLSIMYLVLGIAAFITMGLQHTCLTIVGQRVTDTIREQSYKKILKMPIKWHDQIENNAGTLSSRLSTDCATINALATTLYGVIVSAISSYIAGMIIAFTASWKITLIALSVSPLIMIVGRQHAKLAQGFSEKDDTYFKDAGLLVMESVTNIRTIASFGNEKLLFKNYTEKVENPRKRATINGIKAGITFGLSQFIIFAIYALTFYCGAIFVRDDGLRIDHMFKALFGIIMAAFGSGNASQFLPDIGKAQTAADDLFKIMDCEDELQYAEKAKKLNVEINEINGDIEFCNVYFRYPNRKRFVFIDLNLKIEAGKKIALVGPSGCGKSTIVSLLLRFYEIQKGEIKLDGKNIKDYDLKKLRSYFGVVNQEPVLFSGTVEDNIRYNTENATMDDIQNVAKQANALEFILKNDFDTVSKGDNKDKENFGEGFQRKVGSKGSQISGGQKQRIAIARALLKRPKILLLDEATSALDGPSEKVVQESLDQIMQNKSSVTIAHRLSTIKNHDKIFVFNEGKIVEEGNYEELIRKNGFFFNFQKGHN